MDRPRVFLGLRTVIYGAKDLDRAKEWYSKAFGIDPYFDQAYYVGYNVGGFELGLDPNAPSGAGGTTAYWRVANIGDAMTHLESAGATVAAPVNEVGEGIKVAVALDPFGNRLGVIEDPTFDPSSTT
ncbi:MAG: VOC family protein [Gemmatimonadales bacterium]